jgi:hypothetical protein
MYKVLIGAASAPEINPTLAASAARRTKTRFDMAIALRLSSYKMPVK